MLLWMAAIRILTSTGPLTAREGFQVMYEKQLDRQAEVMVQRYTGCCVGELWVAWMLGIARLLSRGDTRSQRLVAGGAGHWVSQMVSCVGRLQGKHTGDGLYCMDTDPWYDFLYGDKSIFFLNLKRL